MNAALQNIGAFSSTLKQRLDTPFISVGYDYARLGKKFTGEEVKDLKSNCIYNKEIYYYKRNRKISFEIYGTLVFLRICPPKLLRSENIRLATPEEMGKALNKVQRETGLNFWDGWVRELHFTFTLQTPEPYVCYRSLIRSQHPPRGYRYKKQDHGDYFNGKRVTLLFYDKSEEYTGVYPESLQKLMSGAIRPELFRGEIKIVEEVRKVLVASGCWDIKKTAFLASDLSNDQTFQNLTLYAKKFIFRFLNPLKKTLSEKISSEQAAFRGVSATDAGYSYFVERYKRKMLTEKMFRRVVRLNYEAKEQERNEYIRKHLTDKMTTLLAEHEPEPGISKQSKRSLQKVYRGRIISYPPNRKQGVL